MFFMQEKKTAMAFTLLKQMAVNVLKVRGQLLFTFLNSTLLTKLSQIQRVIEIFCV